MSTKPIENFYWVIPGKFLAGEYPGSFYEDDAKKRIQSLLRSGLTCFIDLTGVADNREPYAHLLLENNSISYTQFHLPDYSVPSSKDETIKVLNAIDKALTSGHMVYLHCWGGIGRTGMIVGCWLARHGRQGHDALSHLRALWNDW